MSETPLNRRFDARNSENRRRDIDVERHRLLDTAALHGVLARIIDD